MLSAVWGSQGQPSYCSCLWSLLLCPWRDHWEVTPQDNFSSVWLGCLHSPACGQPAPFLETSAVFLFRTLCWSRWQYNKANHR